MTKYRETDLANRLKPDTFFEALIRDRKPFAKGSSREVFTVEDDDAVVVKRARNPYPGANMTEWFVWNGVRQSPLAETFAEVLNISESGRYLMMIRLAPLTQARHADVPMVPVWLNDRKESAFGELAGTVKVMDYGLVDMERLFDLTQTEKTDFQAKAAFKRLMKEPGW